MGIQKLTGRHWMAILAVMAGVSAGRIGAQAAPPKAAAPSSAVPAPAPTTAPTTDPAWPVNAAASPAVVKWDSQGLRISAKNSSLREILNQVTSRTGATLEGLTSDERVFGEYGPGPAKEVLAQLLHGSAYNVMLIGEQGQGTPRQIVLSPRVAANTNPVQHAAVQQQNNVDDDPEPVVDDTPPPPPPPITRPNMPPNQNQPNQQPNPNQPPPPL